MPDGAEKGQTRKKMYGDRVGSREWKQDGDGDSEAVFRIRRKAGVVLLLACIPGVQIY